MFYVAATFLNGHARIKCDTRGCTTAYTVQYPYCTVL